MIIPIDHSRRLRTTQTEILRAFLARVREVEGLNEQNAVLSDQPMPKDPPPGGKLLVTVSPAGGPFKLGSSAHHACTTEESRIVIGIFAINMRDRMARSESKLLDDDSFSDMKRKILAKLLVEDPALKASSPHWEPTREVLIQNAEFPAGVLRRVPILREPSTPVDCSGPMDAWKNWTGIQITWDVVFDWDLYD